jgi:hypothetical protein
MRPLPAPLMPSPYLLINIVTVPQRKHSCASTTSSCSLTDYKQIRGKTLLHDSTSIDSLEVCLSDWLNTVAGTTAAVGITVDDR